MAAGGGRGKGSSNPKKEANDQRVVGIEGRRSVSQEQLQHIECSKGLANEWKTVMNPITT